MPEGTKFGAVAEQLCHRGHESSGSTTIECLASGNWSDGPVTCTPKGRIYSIVCFVLNKLYSLSLSLSLSLFLLLFERNVSC